MASIKFSAGTGLSWAQETTKTADKDHEVAAKITIFATFHSTKNVSELIRNLVARSRLPVFGIVA
jgi:hypothetical protein